MSQGMTTQTVKDLAEVQQISRGPSGEKADAVWEAACENLDKPVTKLADEFGQYVSESYIREVLKESPPEAFGL